MKLEQNFLQAIDKYCSDKNLDRSVTKQLIDECLIKIFRKENNLLSYEGSDIKIDYSSKGIYFLIPKTATSNALNSVLEISLEDAKKIRSECSENEKVVVEEKLDFSRIRLNDAKNLIFSRLRGYEKNLLFEEYKKKENELIHGYYQTKKGENYIVDLGKLEAIMPKREQISTEKYRLGDRLKALIKKVENRPKELYPTVVLTRSSPKFIEKIFALEVPEIYDGIIEIVNVVREPTIRTKVLVRANREHVDPVGSCVGVKGIRIQSIIRELGRERIDIIPYSEDPIELLKSAIAPAIPKDIQVNTSIREALIIVDENMLSSAIGMNGSNVRLSGKLCNYKIDIRTESQYKENSSFSEKKENLDKLFQKIDEPNKKEETDKNFTPLSQLGFSKRLIDILQAESITCVEDLIDKNEDEIANIKGIGKTTASKIVNTLLELVEFD